MIEKVIKLQELGLSLANIERESKLGNGTLSQVLKNKKYKKTTERKVNEFYFNVIKNLVNGL